MAWNAPKDLIAIRKAVENLSNTLQQFTELEKKTREQVINVINSGSKEAARTIARTLSEKTEKVFTKQTTEAANYLSRRHFRRLSMADR